MLNVAVARKYARALFEASLKAGTAERVNADLESLLSLHQADPGVLKFLVSPDVDTEQKHAFLMTVFGGKIDGMVMGFLRLLVDKGRIVNLPGICTEFRALSEEHRGFVRARVETAVPMQPEQETRLVGELARISGKQVILEKRVNPSILGGAVVHLGGKIIDRSVRRGLRVLSDSLLAAES